MPTAQSLPWIDPLAAAAGVDDAYWILLHSGAATGGRYSILARGLAGRIEGDDFAPLAALLGNGAEAFDNAWFGYLGYGLKHRLERLPPDLPGFIPLPDLCMMRFKTIYRFDHEQRTVSAWSEESMAPLTAGGTPDTPPPIIASLHSNMTRSEYLARAAHVIERIHAGDLYQANLTRKFSGEFAEAPDAFALFRRLCAASPSRYSAYVRMNDAHILSSSPELFLKLDTRGRVWAQPIKGTAPRSPDPEADRRIAEALTASAKDRAENLMIVDLMRNDLARACIPGSVHAEKLFELTSHATVHHLSSTLTGTKLPQCTALDVVMACFPPGSMTGAPKIRAMTLCSEMERQARGVYSGALGWFGGDGSCELSVIIRTLILRGRQFEFQVGGGIVADSTPEAELAEHLHKSRSILSALGLPASFLENI